MPNKINYNYEQMFKIDKQKGFTLIELLVVIAIIGLISSVVLASLNTARIKGRDARRISDIKQLQIALEFYYDKNGYYPPFDYTADRAGGGDGWASDCWESDEFENALNPLVTEKFMPIIPTEPHKSTGYPQCYYYTVSYGSNGCSNISIPSGKYTIIFKGESSNSLNLNYLKYGDWDGDGNWDDSLSFNRWCVIP
jgi:prepilin-type N-terminal cleavage/methylation domain-containing protein